MVRNKSETRAMGRGVNKQIPPSPSQKAVANLMQFGNQLDPPSRVVGLARSVERQVLEVSSILEESLEDADVGTTIGRSHRHH